MVVAFASRWSTISIVLVTSIVIAAIWHRSHAIVCSQTTAHAASHWVVYLYDGRLSSLQCLNFLVLKNIAILSLLVLSYLAHLSFLISEELPLLQRNHLELLLFIHLLLAKHLLLLNLALEYSFVTVTDFILRHFLLFQHLLSHEFSSFIS